jgi:uncharacterized protein YunC (DUF1805 family)
MSEFPENPVNNRGITAIIVKGYKAIADEINVEIAPLTIFAGKLRMSAYLNYS